MPKIPGCPTTSGRILQNASKQRFSGYSDPQSSVQQIYEQHMSFFSLQKNLVLNRFEFGKLIMHEN